MEVGQTRGKAEHGDMERDNIVADVRSRLVQSSSHSWNGPDWSRHLDSRWVDFHLANARRHGKCCRSISSLSITTQCVDNVGWRDFDCSRTLYDSLVHTQSTFEPSKANMLAVIEMFLTAELVFTIFMLAAEKHKGTFIAPVGIGLALFIAELAGVFYTGGMFTLWLTDFFRIWL